MITKFFLQYLRFENKLNHNYNLSFQIKNTHNKNKIKIKQEYIIYWIKLKHTVDKSNNKS